MTQADFMDLYRKAHDADKAFAESVTAHGYKSRWDVTVIPVQSQALRDAYFAKIEADEDLHLAFEAMRLAKAEA